MPSVSVAVDAQYFDIAVIALAQIWPVCFQPPPSITMQTHWAYFQLIACNGNALEAGGGLY